MSSFNYTIREYNEDEKYIIVDYDDGSWARIGFVNKIPSTQSELDDLVSRYTKSKEQIEITEADDSFVKNAIGKSYEAQRYSFANPPVAAANPYADVLEDLDKDSVKDIVIQVLKEEGIISE